MNSKRHLSNSFVLRIWWEEGNGDLVWRGWIQHAASGNSHGLRQLSDLLAFIETYTGSLAQAQLPASGKDTLEQEDVA